MLRVLVVAPVAAEGGANRVVLALVRNAAYAGLSCHVVVLEDGPLVDRLAAAGAEYTLMPAGRVRKAAALVRTHRRLLSLARRLQPDVVFASEAKGHLYASPVALRLRVPAVWRQPAFPGRRVLIDVLASLLPARGVIVASLFVETLQLAMRFSPPVIRIPPGVEVADFHPDRSNGERVRDAYGIAADVPVVGIVGRLARWKGQDVFLRSAALLADRHPAARFVIVGGAELAWDRSDYPVALRRLAHELGIADRTLFIGQVEDPGAWYSAMDVMVNASETEPFGLVLLEAMAAEVPVVAIAAGGPPEIIRDGQTGLLTERDPRLLANAVGRLLDDAELRASLGAAGRRDVLARFTSEGMAISFAAVFRELTGESARGRRSGSSEDRAKRQADHAMKATNGPR